MKTRLLSSLPALSLLALGSALLAPTAVNAATVTYGTTASQLCVGAIGCGTNSQTLGGPSGVTLSFVPAPSTTFVSTPASFTFFGSLQATCAAGGTGCAEQNLTGQNLFLYVLVSQTTPTAGNSLLLTGAFSGSIGGSSSTAQMSWAPGSSTTIGNVTYSAGVFNANNVFLNPVSNGRSAQILGSITSTEPAVIPLPASSLLLLSGLVGLGMLRGTRRTAPTVA